MSTPDIAPLVVADVHAWRAWLDEQEGVSDGVWLMLAKKGTTSPTSLSYAQALDEALCSGWIDGQIKSIDESIFMRRFTPRRKYSLWSTRNIEHIQRLSDEGRIRPSGIAEIERAKSDGRWDAAYAGSATMEVPGDLTIALAQDDAARRTFESLNSQNRYSILHRVTTARTPETRARRLARALEQLARGETPYPQ
ncbi:MULTISPECIES: YdeI family protein [unclassified Leucobacter]|uniref:YdeI/OmpD-associated family protein n=1 Tax=unclassified Leucobacter TaxID=2621730 RepID=UPI00165D3618|nr:MULTISPECIES: YdeI/OmpD-associated family protein [unclassified Leucobacter]MBC9927828.1 YdeI/OmpD-associated family protein [Leucobacter sp. cx-169]